MTPPDEANSAFHPANHDHARTPDNPYGGLFSRGQVLSGQIFVVLSGFCPDFEVAS
jgi:hypothetical protein